VAASAAPRSAAGGAQTRGGRRGAQNSSNVIRKTRTIEATEIRPQPMPLYHTIVHNCSCHSFDDVIFGLMRIVGTGLRDAEL
jgi:hypothetical protein